MAAQDTGSRARAQGRSGRPGREQSGMLVMVVERFPPGGAAAVYGRLEAEGRLAPDRLRYVDSWVRADLRGCFQLMECDDPLLLQEWVARWGELADFEIVPVTRSADTRALMGRLRAGERPPA
jgi:hypothetical protein